MRSLNSSPAAGAASSVNVPRQSADAVVPARTSVRSTDMFAPSAPVCVNPEAAEPTRRNAAALKSCSPCATLKSNAAPPPFSK